MSLRVAGRMAIGSGNGHAIGFAEDFGVRTPYVVGFEVFRADDFASLKMLPSEAGDAGRRRGDQRF